ncbi:MAG: single-stranded DNA-binding protein [Bacteroidales bacterium]|jgi:single-stranded DNA-binding protein|nr:single-stranded DNA-binding protein [Bacteroidales bacterium]
MAKRKKREHVNIVELSGIAINDPIVKKLNNGKIKAEFSLSTHQLYKKNNGTFAYMKIRHNIVAWNYIAIKVLESVREGCFVAVEGALRSREFINSNNKQENFIYIFASKLSSNIVV